MVTGRIVEGGYQVQLNGVINIIVNMIKIVIQFTLPTHTSITHIFYIKFITDPNSQPLGILLQFKKNIFLVPLCFFLYCKSGTILLHISP